MNSSTWHKLTEFCRDREAAAHQRELARRPDWTEETEDGRHGDVDRRMTMLQSLFIYAATLLILGVLFFSCRRANGEEMPPTGVSALLYALAMVESGNNPRAIGRHGEVTEFQFRRETLAEANHGWAAHNQKGSVQGLRTNPPARLAAAFHLGALSKKLSIAMGRVPTPPELYAAWNLGFTRFRRAGFSLGRIPSGSRDAASRFGNLVQMNAERGMRSAELTKSAPRIPQSAFPVPHSERREGVGIPGRSHKPLFAGSIPAPAPSFAMTKGQ